MWYLRDRSRQVAPRDDLHAHEQQVLIRVVDHLEQAHDVRVAQMLHDRNLAEHRVVRRAVTPDALAFEDGAREALDGHLAQAGSGSLRGTQRHSAALSSTQRQFEILT